MRKMNNPERVAPVTGANRGIGFEITRQLAKLGHHVIIGSRDPESGKKATEKIASERINGKVKSTELDITDEGAVTGTKNMIEAEFGRLDILVNNAAILVDESNLQAPLH